MEVPPPAPRRRRKEARPAEIVAAALATFAEHGFAAARLEDVAARAGVSKGTIYLYFETKEALFEAVIRDAFGPLLDGIGAAGHAPDATSEDLLRGFLRTAYRELVETERRQIVRLIVAEAARIPELVDFYHREVIVRGKALLADLLARGVARSEFRAAPVAEAPEILVAPVILAAIWRMTFEPLAPLDLERFIGAHLDLVLAGLRVPPPEA